MAEHAGAYWLVDEIVFAQVERSVAKEEFQHWTLKLNQSGGAELACDDGNGATVYEKKISFTDFPLNEISLYFTDRTLLLPSEY